MHTSCKAQPGEPYGLTGLGQLFTQSGLDLAVFSVENRRLSRSDIKTQTGNLLTSSKYVKHLLSQKRFFFQVIILFNYLSVFFFIFLYTGSTFYAPAIIYIN